MTQPDARHVVASYCATFLKPEMLHIYRQIAALERVRPFVIAQKRENAERFPFADVVVVPKPAAHELRRFWFRKVRNAPWQISRAEAARLRSVLDQRGAQLLHIYFGHIAVHLLPLMREWPNPTVVSFHGADVGVDLDIPAYRAAAAQMLAAARLVLVRSESLGRALAALGCPSAKLRVHRTGIPLDQFPFRERAWPATGEWRLVQAGRLIAKKGIATSLRAFAQFTRRFPQATFTIAGEGPLRTALEFEARSLGIDDRVRFTGFLSQAGWRDLLYESHLFLHPSETGADGNQEGVPNAMLEAMSSGLPVFATTHGGIPEAVENGISGVLVPEHDHDALASALIGNADAPNELSLLARGGADAVRRKFEHRMQVHQLEEYYLDLINRSPAAVA